MCNAGYYCPGGNDGPEPPGMECPPGYYCETGVGYPIACPNGTFSNTSKNTELSNCLSCTPGMYRKLFVGVILLICILLSCCFEPPGMECPLGYYCVLRDRGGGGVSYSIHIMNVYECNGSNMFMSWKMECSIQRGEAELNGSSSNQMARICLGVIE